MITAVFVCIIGARANAQLRFVHSAWQNAFARCVIRLASCIWPEKLPIARRTMQTATGDCWAEVQKSVKGIILIGARADYAQRHSLCSLRSSIFKKFLFQKSTPFFHLVLVLGPPTKCKREKQSLSNEHNWMWLVFCEDLNNIFHY